MSLLSLFAVSIMCLIALSKNLNVRTASNSSHTTLHKVPALLTRIKRLNHHCCTSRDEIYKQLLIDLVITYLRISQVRLTASVSIGHNLLGKQRNFHSIRPKVWNTWRLAIYVVWNSLPIWCARIIVILEFGYAHASSLSCDLDFFGEKSDLNTQMESPCAIQQDTALWGHKGGLGMKLQPFETMRIPIWNYVFMKHTGLAHSFSEHNTWYTRHAPCNLLPHKNVLWYD